MSVFKSTDPFMSLWLVILISFMKIERISNRNVVSTDANSRISVEHVVVILRFMIFAMNI